MKILFFTDIYFPVMGGIEVVTRRLAKQLIQNGNNVEIVAPSLNGKNSEVFDKGIKVHCLASLPIPYHQHFRYSPYSLSKIKINKIFNEFNPDVIHVQTCFAIGKAAIKIAKRNNVPIVC